MKKENESLLITGAFGALGRAVLREFSRYKGKLVAFDIAPKPDLIEDLSDKVKIVKGDITEITDLIRTVKEEDIDNIAHLAAIHLIRVSKANPLLAYKVNLTGTLNILETARIMKLKRVVFISSISTFGLKATVPRKEDDAKKPTSLYGVTKLAGELFGLNYAENYGVDFIALRFPLLFGPGSISTWDPPRTIAENCLRGKPAVITGPPDDKILDILYTKNAAKAIRLALEAKNLTHRIFNISQEPLSLNDIVKAAKKIIPDASIEIRPTEHFFMLMDDTRAKQELGYKPAYSFENAFKDYVDYLRQTSQR